MARASSVLIAIGVLLLFGAMAVAISEGPMAWRKFLFCLSMPIFALGIVMEILDYHKAQKEKEEKERA